MENPKNRKWNVLTSEYLARKPWFSLRHESHEPPDGRRIPGYSVLECPTGATPSPTCATGVSCASSSTYTV